MEILDIVWVVGLVEVRAVRLVGLRRVVVVVLAGATSLRGRGVGGIGVVGLGVGQGVRGSMGIFEVVLWPWGVIRVGKQ